MTPYKAKQSTHANDVCLAHNCAQPDMCKRHVVIRKMKLPKHWPVLNNACSVVGTDMFEPINQQESE